jgi:hypothetical protein
VSVASWWVFYSGRGSGCYFESMGWLKQLGLTNCCYLGFCYIYIFLVQCIGFIKIRVFKIYLKVYKILFKVVQHIYNFFPFDFNDFKKSFICSTATANR